METMERAKTYPIREKWNSFLATRERGRRVREDIEHELERLPVDRTLALDFAGVEGITVSFGDECLAKLILARAAGDFVDRGLVVEGCNEDVSETIETVLERRKLAVVALSPGEGWELLGGPSWLPQTLAAALALGSFKATELADQLKLSPQAANNRLGILVASGAILRQRAIPEGGGKEFSYTSAVPALA